MKKRTNYVTVFLLTLSAVLFAGLLTLFVLSAASSSPAVPAGEAQPLTIAEKIPEGSVPSAGLPDSAGDDLSTAGTADTGKTVSAAEDTVSVTLAFAGDLLFDENYAAGTALRSRGVTGCFDEAALDVMRSADLFMVNNEFCYMDEGTPLPDKQYTLHAKTDTAVWLEDIGADLVSIANNHVYDYGEDGLLNTLHTLESIGMPYVGAGRNIDEAARPYILETGGMKIAILCATQIERYPVPDTKGATADSPGVFRVYDMTPLYDKVREVRQTADFVIVYIHWGNEKESLPVAAQTDSAKELEAAGADLVIGDHPHVLQPVSFINEMPVFYSMGNFLFTSYKTDTGLASITLDTKAKKISNVRFIPMRQENTALHLLTGDDKQQLLQKMQAMSQDVMIDADGNIQKRP
ncbi:MAG: CapA family protein [Firmicutes bacterium]|nr:CapA family protein [Bacillota bacterium]